MLRKPLILCASLALVAIPFAIAACGSSDDPTSTTVSESESTTESTTSAASGGGESVLAFSETEFKIDPSDPTAKAGNVTLAVKNDGSVTHNLEIEGNGVEEVTDDLSPGQSGELNVDLKPGDYEIYCAIDSHKDMGMEGSITVQ